MVLTRADRDDICELIQNTLDKYLSSSEVNKKLGIFEKISTEIKSSLDVLTERFETRIAKLESENVQLCKRLNDYEQYSRRNCLRVFGVEEDDNEDVYVKVREIFDKMHVNVEGHIDRCHRIGKKLSKKDGNNQKNPTQKNSNRRSIIVKFTSYFKRNQVFNNKKLLKGQGISVLEDLTSANYALFKRAQTRFGFRQVWTLDGNIYCNINGSRHAVRSVEDLGRLDGGADHGHGSTE